MLPDKAYIRESLFLPKRGINVEMVKTSLTFQFSENTYTCYQEQGDHIKVPRNFISWQKIRSKWELIDLRPTKFKKTKFKDTIEPNSQVQREAIKAIEGKEGTLVLPCGVGKTIIALKEIARRNAPALIIVNTENLMQQWIEQGIVPFLGMDNIGIIKQDLFEWDRPIVIATIQTLSKRAQKLSEKIKSYYSLIVWDEVDEMATPVYSMTSDLFYGDRLGLTATPTRRDGADVIYRYHIGPVLYKSEQMGLTPKVFFIINGSTMPASAYTWFYNAKYNYGKLFTLISEDVQRRERIIVLINMLLSQGRKILVIGERKQELKELYEYYPDSGLCIGEVDVEERWRALRECSVIFSIRKLSKRGLNQVDLDTLVILHPMSDPGGITQACGRILRECPTKLEPHIYIIKDVNITPLNELCVKMEKYFKGVGYEPTFISKLI